MTGPLGTRAGRVLLLALVAGAFAWAGCSAPSTEGSDDGRVTHREGEGPLSVSGAGGNSIRAPRQTPWLATFGWTTPCTTTGNPVTIEAIRYHFKVEPLSVRNVVFEAQPWHGTTGFGSIKGTPEDALRNGEVRGSFLGKPQGYRVTNSCNESSADDVVQILTVLKAGSRGAEITSYTIDYISQDKAYALEVDWQMVACGTDTSVDMCP